jgi:hypothetical protein
VKGYFKLLILIIFGLAVLAPFASKAPDGLEKVVETFGIEEHEPLWKGLMPDYSLPIINDASASTTFAGVIGVFLVFIVAFMLGKAITQPKNE